MFDNPVTFFKANQVVGTETALVSIYQNPLYQSPFNTCYPVTAKLIKRCIIGNPTNAEKKIIIKAIMETLKIDPVINEYISIVFNHLPGFQIMISTGESLVGERGAYSPGTRTLVLEHDLLQPSLLEPIRHEFRHAVMHAVQMTRSKSNPILTECYFPLTESEQIKIADYLKKGDEKIENLAKLLKREKEHKLSSQEEKYLKELRDSSQEIYAQHYEVSFPYPMSYTQSEAKKSFPIGKMKLFSMVAPELKKN